MKKYIITFLIIFLFPIYVLAYSNKVILGGQNLGIAIESDGILVVGFYKVNNTLNNSKLSVGDYIIKVNNDKVNTVDDLINSIENNVKDNKVNITYRHNNSIKDTILNLEYNNGIYKSGLYVKDSLKGLGTLTYIDYNRYKLAKANDVASPQDVWAIDFWFRTGTCQSVRNRGDINIIPSASYNIKTVNNNMIQQMNVSRQIGNNNNHNNSNVNNISLNINNIGAH